MKALIATVLGTAIGTLALSSTALAGVANTEFSCISESGRTQLEASVPGDYLQHDVKFTIDDALVEYFDRTDYEATGKRIVNSKVTMLGNTMDVSKDYGFVVSKKGKAMLTFIVVNGTAKIRHTNLGEKGVMKAKVQGVDPRTGKASKEITLNCRYRNEI